MSHCPRVAAPPHALAPAPSTIVSRPRSASPASRATSLRGGELSCGRPGRPRRKTPDLARGTLPQGLRQRRRGPRRCRLAGRASGRRRPLRSRDRRRCCQRWTGSLRCRLAAHAVNAAERSHAWSSDRCANDLVARLRALSRCTCQPSRPVARDTGLRGMCSSQWRAAGSREAIPPSPGRIRVVWARSASSGSVRWSAAPLMRGALA